MRKIRVGARPLGERSVLGFSALAIVGALAVLEAERAFAGGVATLVREIGTAPPEFRAAGARQLGNVGDEVFFAGRDASNGTELWRTDGTEAGTTLVADVRPGPEGSSPKRPVDLGGVAFFFADDGVHGEELWRSDGTAAGTELVFDIRPGPEGSFASGLTVAGGILYFAAHDGATGWEPWRSDGTPEGTYSLGDVSPGGIGSDPQNFTGLGGLVLFLADDGTTGYEIWRSDGTPGSAERVADVNPGPLDIFSPVANDFWAHRGSFPVLDGYAYFPASDGTSGFELWRTDGTDEGTEKFFALGAGAESAFSSPRLVAGDSLFFSVSASLGATPTLWRTDGTEVGTVEIAPVGPQPFEDILLHDGTIYFVADRAKLWKSDGSSAELVYDVGRPACQPNHWFRHLTPVGDRIFMAGRSPGADEELWVTDGTALGTREVKEIVSGRENGPRQLRAVGDTLVFVIDDGVHGRELWRSDGTEAGTEMVVDLLSQTEGFVSQLERTSAIFGGRLYFGGFARTGLRRTDGTEAGTQVVPGTAGLVLASAFRGPRRVVDASSDEVFFWTGAGAFDAVLRTTDGTASGLRTLGTFGMTCDQVEQVPLAGGLVFGGCQSGVGMEPWWSDGTVAGTVPLEVRPGPLGGHPRALTRFGDQVLFFADDGVHGRELWRTDGTGVFLVKDIRPGAGHGVGYELGNDNNLRHIVAADDVAYFVGNDGEHGKELWKTDGTAAGTVMVRDIAPGALGGLGLLESSQGVAAWAVTEDGILYFLRFVFGAGWQLWRSDGTEAGTRIVVFALPADAFTFPFEFLNVWTVGETAFFTGLAPNETSSGLRLWRSNGTAPGTTPFPEIIDTLGLTLREEAFYFAPEGTLRVLETGASASAAIGSVSGEGAYVDAAIVPLAGRPLFEASDGVSGGELWTSSCGDGAVEHDEACDDGAANGRVGSCCTRGCEVRTWPASDVDGDGSIDWCDAEEGTISLDLVTVRRRANTARLDGRIRVQGDFPVGVAGFEPSEGFSVRVADAGALDLVLSFSSEECRAVGPSARCRRDGEPWADLRLRRTDDDVSFRLTVKRLEVEGLLAGPVDVTLTQGGVIDRTGTSASCSGGANRLACR